MIDETHTPEPADARRALDIVALDDDPDFREYITDALERDGHSVRTCTRPDQFYEAAAERLPDVLLLDMHMGKHTGEEVLVTIRERWAKLCVIVITGHPSLETMRTTFKQDVFDYIAKPFSIEVLRAALAQAADTFHLGRSDADRLRSELGRRIRLARTERGWTLKELSENSGVSVSQLSSIERGAHLPSLESLLSVAGALGDTPSKWLDAAGF
ncbi:MAG: response regulator [Planctomycetota bacterium]